MFEQARPGSAEFDRLISEQLIVRHLGELEGHGLVERDPGHGRLKPTRLGELMSQHCIRFKTMAHLVRLPHHASMPDLLMAVASSEELSNIRYVRRCPASHRPLIQRIPPSLPPACQPPLAPCPTPHPQALDPFHRHSMAEFSH